MKKYVYMFFAWLVILTTLFFSILKAGGDRVMVKVLKKEKKADEKIDKDRKDIANMSDDDINNELLDD